METVMRIQYLGVGLLLAACSSKTVDQDQLPNDNAMGNQGGNGGNGGMTTPSDASSSQHPTPNEPMPDASPEASSGPDEGGSSTTPSDQSEWTWRGGDLGSTYHNTR